MGQLACKCMNLNFCRKMTALILLFGYMRLLNEVTSNSLLLLLSYGWISCSLSLGVESLVVHVVLLHCRGMESLLWELMLAHGSVLCYASRNVLH